MTPFKVMTSLLTNQTPTKEQKSTMNSFFLVRWLSNNINTVPLAGIVNRWYKMPTEIQYQFSDDWISLMGLKGRIKFIKYEQTQNQPKIIEAIQDRYKINEAQALVYAKMLPNKEKDEIQRIYDQKSRR